MSKSGQGWFIKFPPNDNINYNYHQPPWSQQFVKQLSDSLQGGPRISQNGPASCMTQAVIEVIEVTLLADMIYGILWLYMIDTINHMFIMIIWLYLYNWPYFNSWLNAYDVMLKTMALSLPWNPRSEDGVLCPCYDWAFFPIPLWNSVEMWTMIQMI